MPDYIGLPLAILLWLGCCFLFAATVGLLQQARLDRIRRVEIKKRSLLKQ